MIAPHTTSTLLINYSTDLFENLFSAAKNTIFACDDNNNDDDDDDDDDIPSY